MLPLFPYHTQPSDFFHTKKPPLIFFTSDDPPKFLFSPPSSHRTCPPSLPIFFSPKSPLPLWFSSRGMAPTEFLHHRSSSRSPFFSLDTLPSDFLLTEKPPPSDFLPFFRSLLNVRGWEFFFFVFWVQCICFLWLISLVFYSGWWEFIDDLVSFKEFVLICRMVGGIFRWTIYTFLFNNLQNIWCIIILFFLSWTQILCNK